MLQDGAHMRIPETRHHGQEQLVQSQPKQFMMHTQAVGVIQLVVTHAEPKLDIEESSRNVRLEQTPGQEGRVQILSMLLSQTSLEIQTEMEL